MGKGRELCQRVQYVGVGVWYAVDPYVEVCGTDFAPDTLVVVHSLTFTPIGALLRWRQEHNVETSLEGG